MSQQNYDALKEEITAIPMEEVKIPNMPVHVYLQEASDLGEWSKEDQPKLLAINTAQELFDGLEARIGALRYAQSLWNKERYTKEEAQREWDEKSPDGYDLKDELENDFRFAFRRRSDLLSKVSAIEDGTGHADMVQDLSDLAALGKANLPLLQTINFDETKLTRAENQSTELSTLLAKANGERQDTTEPKVMRDKAYTYLKKAVDEIQAAGKYVFWKDDVRRKGYYSKYLNKR